MNLKNNIYFWNFLFILQFAIYSYFVLDYFKNILFTSQEINIIFTLGAIVSIIATIFIPKILKKFSIRRSLVFSLIIMIFFQIGWAFFLPPILIAITYILSYFAGAIIVVGLDGILEKITQNDDTGSVRGIYMTVSSVAIVIGIFLSGQIVKYSFNYIWVAGALIYTFLLFSIYIKYKDIPHLNYKIINLKNSFKEIINNKNIIKISIINFFLMFFYATMVLYTAHFLISFLKIPIDKIGIIFAISLTPFIFLTYPLGKIADTKIGEKEIMFIGFFVMLISTFLFGFLKNDDIFIITTILFFTRIGASFVQTMVDTYFFKQINSQQIDIITLYRGMAPLANIFAPIFAIIILYFLSFNYIFILMSISLIIPLFITFSLKDTR